MSSSLTGEKAHFSLLSLLHLYKKSEMVGLPKVAFGLPNLSFSQRFTFSNVFTKYYKIQRWPIPYEEGPAWISRNFFHAVVSLAMPSKVLGSKNWIFISNFSAWFLIASILAGLKRSWSSKNCTLTARWPTSFFKTRSSMALICCVLASASWYLLCNISMKVSWSGNSSSLC